MASKNAWRTSRAVHDITHEMTREVDTPPGKFKQAKELLERMLASGLIRPSRSEWSSKVVWVSKRDGTLKLCLDFRPLNAVTVKVAQCALTPRVQELPNALAGAQNFFSVLELKDGYHQVRLCEGDKDRTGFTVAPLGSFEYNRMTLGLAHVPETYQRTMVTSLGSLRSNICFVFLDEIIVFSNTFEEHLERLRKVLDRLRTNGLKLDPKKCSLTMDKARFVGHSVSASGAEADLHNSKIKN